MSTNAQTAISSIEKKSHDAKYVTNESAKSTTPTHSESQNQSTIKTDDPYVSGMLRQKELLTLLLKYEVLEDKIAFYNEQLAWIERSLAMVKPI